MKGNLKPKGANTGRWQAHKLKPVVKKRGEQMKKKPKRITEKNRTEQKPQGYTEAERKRYQLPSKKH